MSHLSQTWRYTDTRGDQKGALVRASNVPGTFTGRDRADKGAIIREWNRKKREKAAQRKALHAEQARILREALLYRGE